MKVEKICPYCGKPFVTSNNKKKFCSSRCNTLYYREKYKNDKCNKLLEEGIENVDYVIDRWNGLPTVRIYGQWFKKMHPGRTIEEYLAEFPDAPLYSENDCKNTSINSGKHMKEEKYRKMFSEKFSGENNPRHHTKISEQEIRESSPYCEEFYTKRGLDSSLMNITKQKCIENRTIDKQNTSVEFYLSIGMSQKEAEDARSERQRTFTLEKCIERYGEEEGRRRYEERQKNWSSKVEAQYKEGKFSKMPKTLYTNAYSIEEVNFIHKIADGIGVDIDDLFCAESKKGQLFLRDSEGNAYSYDFCFNHHIIEYDGDFWHANPNRYTEDILVYGKSTAKDIWDKDRKKKDVAEFYGYKILRIWESEYRKDPDGIMKKCIEFIES